MNKPKVGEKGKYYFYSMFQQRETADAAITVGNCSVYMPDGLFSLKKITKYYPDMVVIQFQEISKEQYEKFYSE